MKKITLLLLIFSFSAHAKRVFNIGLVFEFGNSFDSTVSQMYRGFVEAQKYLESQDKTIQFKFHKFSHGRKYTSIINQIEKVKKQNLDVIIGGEDSDEAIVMANLLEGTGKLLITPTATNPRVTLENPNVFRTTFTDDFVAGALARFVNKEFSGETIGVYHNVSYPYTDFLAKEFIRVFKQLNPKGKLIVVKGRKNQVNYQKGLKKFKKAGVTKMVTLVFQSELLRLMTQAYEMGFNPTYIGSDGLGSHYGTQSIIAKANPEKQFEIYKSEYWNEEYIGKYGKLFQKAFRNMPSKDVSGYEAIAFDTMIVLGKALINSKKTKKPLKESLMKTDLKGMVTTSRFVFDKTTRSPKKDLFIYRITDKESKFFKRFKNE